MTLDMNDRTLLGRAQAPATPDAVASPAPAHGSVVGHVNRLLATLIFGVVMFWAGVMYAATVLPGALA
jgi:hypothetical protein